MLWTSQHHYYPWPFDKEAELEAENIKKDKIIEAKEKLLKMKQEFEEEANRKKMKSICFLGRDGGFTKGIATLDLIVQGPSTARIQEAQKLLFHVLCETVDEELPKK